MIIAPQADFEKTDLTQVCKPLRKGYPAEYLFLRSGFVMDPFARFTESVTLEGMQTFLQPTNLLDLIPVTIRAVRLIRANLEVLINLGEAIGMTRERGV